MRWALRLPASAWGVFPGCSTGSRVPAVSLLWGGRARSLGRPKQLEFTGQRTAERELQQSEESSPQAFNWILNSTCMWRNYPSLRKEHLKEARETISKVHTRPGMVCIPTNQSGKPHKLWGIKLILQKNIASVVEKKVIVLPDKVEKQVSAELNSFLVTWLHPRTKLKNTEYTMLKWPAHNKVKFTSGIQQKTTMHAKSRKMQPTVRRKVTQ